MRATLCDRCQKLGNKTIVIPVLKNDNIHCNYDFFHGVQVQCLDLCDECFEEYENMLIDFLNFERER